MSELIKVDFKERKVVNRVDLEAPVPEWSAKKDPYFKGFIEGIILSAEEMHKSGGDWRRMVIVLQDETSLEGDVCITLWDKNVVTDEQASDILMIACNKIDIRAEEKASYEES